MAEFESWHRVVASYVPPRSIVTRSRAALRGLGYEFVTAATRGRFHDDSWVPDIRIVDERHIDRVPAEQYLPRTPIVLLTGSRTPRCNDSRIVGSVPRPATLGQLYPLLQNALEDHPRLAPRTDVDIHARCTHADRRWTGIVESLSQGSCVFRSTEAMPEGLELNMLFPLPLGRMVSTRARVVRQGPDRAVMLFNSPPRSIQEALGDYVEGRLAARATPPPFAGR